MRAGIGNAILGFVPSGHLSADCLIVCCSRVGVMASIFAFSAFSAHQGVRGSHGTRARLKVQEHSRLHVIDLSNKYFYCAFAALMLYLIPAQHFSPGEQMSGDYLSEYLFDKPRTINLS
jgi:hypothetical protein